PCSRERLIAQCVEVPETPRVWTPGSAGLVPPEAEPFLVDALRSHRVASARRGVATAASAACGGAALALATGPGARSGWVVLLALVAAWLAISLLGYRQATRTGPEFFALAREEFRHSVWLGSHRATGTGVIL